jgi:hypothetical protein
LASEVLARKSPMRMSMYLERGDHELCRRCNVHDKERHELIEDNPFLIEQRQ